MKCGTFFILLVVYNTTKAHKITRRSSVWQPDDWRLAPDQGYVQVPLLQHKTRAPMYEARLGGQNRHLDWLDEDDKDSAEHSDKGVMATFLGDADDSEEEKIDDHELRNRRRRKYTRIHKMFLPLLIAYKLKYFTMVPLLLGALILLVYTTGIAGFFFALFAAATGLHVKTTRH